jgi:hypothetical protein
LAAEPRCLATLPDVIETCVRWYIIYRLSYGSWWMDETAVRVRGGAARLRKLEHSHVYNEQVTVLDLEGQRPSYRRLAMCGVNENSTGTITTMLRAMLLRR